jgi:hypothetical protein
VIARAIGWPLWMRAALAVLALGLACPGCSTSQLASHVRAAQVSRSTLDVAADGIEAACDPDDVRERDDAQQRARACLKAAGAHDAARVAWVTYVDALVLAADGDSLDIGAVLPLGIGLLSSYRELAEAAAYWGLDLPALPALLGGE